MHTTPQEAVSGLLEAYRSFEVDRIVLCKDFAADARIFWDNLGLPVSDEQLAKSHLAFEENFRKELQTGIPDYADVEFRVGSEERLQGDFVVVTLETIKTDGAQFSLRIPVLRTSDGWKVVLHPAYDHF